MAMRVEQVHAASVARCGWYDRGPATSNE
jgi:hypothetical protein